MVLLGAPAEFSRHGEDTQLPRLFLKAVHAAGRVRVCGP
jgi:hypothetical protein